MKTNAYLGYKIVAVAIGVIVLALVILVAFNQFDDGKTPHVDKTEHISESPKTRATAGAGTLMDADVAEARTAAKARPTKVKSDDIEATVKTESITLPVAGEANSAVLSAMAEDPYGMYEVPEGEINNGFFVERNGKFYAVSAFVPIKNIEKYGVGYDAAGGDTLALLFHRDFEKIEMMPTATPSAFIASGDLPILQVHKDEKILALGSAEILRVSKTEFVGWSMEITGKMKTVYPVINHNLTLQDMNQSSAPKEKPQVCDYYSGDPVVDFRHLDYGRDYNLTWYQNGEEKSLTMTADCKVFQNPDAFEALDHEVALHGEKNENGIIAIDISELETGYYACSQWASVIEVVD